MLIFIALIHAVGIIIFGWKFIVFYPIMALLSLFMLCLGLLFSVGIFIWQVYSFFIDGSWYSLTAMQALNNRTHTGDAPDFYEVFEQLPGLIKILDWMPASIFFGIIFAMGLLMVTAHQNFVAPSFKKLFSKHA